MIEALLRSKRFWLLVITVLVALFRSYLPEPIQAALDDPEVQAAIALILSAIFGGGVVADKVKEAKVQKALGVRPDAKLGPITQEVARQAGQALDEKGYQRPQGRRGGRSPGRR